MKLLRLEILNLASLDNPNGEVINFESGALGESNIFSIVGPTGSGKSTILDAICLALYNRTPRYPKYNRENIQKIEIYGETDDAKNNRIPTTDCRNILTRGKKYGYSKLTFLANNGNVYRAEWSVAFKVKKYEKAICTLYHLAPNGAEEENNWETLPEIIGLDYDQFLRTVLIAQGSFANFLTSKEEERYKLLEKLVGCEEMYSRIAAEIKLKRDEAKSAFDQISAQVEEVQKGILPPEEVETLQQFISDLEKEQNEITKQLKCIDTEIVWYATDELLRNKTIQCQAELGNAQTILFSHKEDIEKLALHDALLPAIDIEREIIRIEKSNAELNLKIQTYNSDVEKFKVELLVEEKKLEEQKNAYQKAQEAIEQAKPQLKQARELKVKIDAADNLCKKAEVAKQNSEKEMLDARKNVKINKEKAEVYSKDLKKEQNNLDELKREVENRKKKQTEDIKLIEKKIEEVRLKIDGQNADKLQSGLSTANAVLADMQTAHRLISELNKNEKEEIDINVQCADIEKNSGEINVALSRLKIEVLQKEVETLKRTYTLMTSEKWDVHRRLLSHGKACPLCGSTEHPYSTNVAAFSSATSDLHLLLIQKEEELNNQTTQKEKLINALTKNNATIAEKRNRQKQLKADNDKNMVQIQQLQKKYTDLSLNIEDVELRIAIAEKQQHEMQKAWELFSKIQREIDELKEKMNAAQKELTQYTESSNNAINKANETVQGIAAELSGCKGLEANLLQQQQEKESAFENAVSNLEKEKEEKKQLEEQCQRIFNGKDPDGVEKQLVATQKQIADIVDKKQIEVSAIRQTIAQKTGELQTMCTNYNADNNISKQKIVNLNTWIEEYNNSAEKIRTVTIADVVPFCNATCNWDTLRSTVDGYKSSVEKQKALLAEAEKNQQEHQGVRPQRSKETLMAEQKTLQEKLENKDLIAAKVRLQQHQESEQKLGSKRDALLSASTANTNWQAISDAIGGADGKLLRKIAQCNTLSFLIAHANNEIRKFNSRYELMHVPHSLGIRIIDHDRADDIRDTTSLSGGETFIVSLGLALGLSAISSHSISFDNLFIDEGFGTLDPETLSVVIDSLAMLQASKGKKVGVISHTDTMSERITTQIRIIKNGHSGSSRIEIYPK